MGQKINPVSLRLQAKNRCFDNCWYSNYFYKNLINKDIVIENYLTNFLKSLKLPTGRYSIQHLLKKTQVYNFFCYSKSTREWRAKLFGLAKKKNLLKKNRYFLRNKTDSRKKRKKFTQLKWFYNTLNQTEVYKIQKKITSFQDVGLWSRLQKPIAPNFVCLPVNSPFKSKSVDLDGSLPLKSAPFYCVVGPDLFFVRKNLTRKENSNQNSSLYLESPLKDSNHLMLVEKTHQLVLKKKARNQQQVSLNKDYSRFLTLKENSSLFFLQNLVIYKIFKSSLKKKNQGNLTGNTVSTKRKSIYPYLENKKFVLALSDIEGQKKVPFNALEYKYKNYLESCLSSLYKLQLELVPFKVKNDWQHANYLADEIVYFLERRIPFRRLKNKILKQLSNISGIRGVRITCSGRVGGKSKKAQRSKTECLKYGQTSLQVFSSKIDFSMKTAFTSFGSVGVKVWICYY